jgi:cytochrome c biogenesis protein CcmG, thiol:disulfide interchange protein DsbE
MIRWIATAALLLATPAIAKPVVGQVAPEFELTLVDGSKVKLSDLRGKVVVLNIWATWCGPCRTELPLLDAYYRINEKHGLRVFALTTEDSVPISQLKKLFAVMAIPSARKVRGGYGDLGGLPTNFVVDRGGRLRYARAGAFDLDTLNEVIIPLLKEPAPPTVAAN